MNPKTKTLLDTIDHLETLALSPRGRGRAENIKIAASFLRALVAPELLSAKEARAKCHCTLAPEFITVSEIFITGRNDGIAYLKCRERHAADTRALSCWLLRRNTKANWTILSRAFGDGMADHSTACERAFHWQDLVDTNPALLAQSIKLEAQLRAKFDGHPELKPIITEVRQPRTPRRQVAPSAQDISPSPAHSLIAKIH